MARAFTKKDVALLNNRYVRLQTVLTETQQLQQKLQNNIQAAVETYFDEQLLSVLNGIDCEQLTALKLGIRTKLLISAGYTNYAQIYRANIRELSAIDGIGAQQATLTKQAVQEAARHTQSTLKLSLSTDDKSTSKTAIINAAAAYLSSYKQVLHCVELQKSLEEQKSVITSSFEICNKVAGGLKWLFGSKQMRAEAENAYALLYELFYGDFGQKIEASKKQAEASAQVSDTFAWQLFEKEPIRFFNLLELIVPGALGSDDKQYGLPGTLAQEVQTQSIDLTGLRCTLRKYQELGVKYILHQCRVLLGDEMGLGKTVQAIASMVALRNKGKTHFLVICPASVLMNWMKEIAKHSDLLPIKIHGSDKEKSFRKWCEQGGVGVTTFESTLNLMLEQHFRYSMLVVDEAHYIKNVQAQRTQNTIRLASYAQNILFMTGTALENRVEEMIHLIAILNPEISEKAQKLAFMSGAQQFRIAIAPVYYRRKREDVLTELPEKIESEEWLLLNDQERAVYENDTLQRAFNRMRRVSWTSDDLALSSKAQRLKEIVDEAAAEGRKIIVFSFYLDVTAKVKELLGERCLEIINGSVSPKNRQEIIDRFERAPAGTVLVSQIIAGGTGLNIQSASVVVLCEPQLKPSTETQAISRAYRMGQTRNVLVYRLLSDDTVDERILEMLSAKQASFDAFADISQAALEDAVELNADNQAQIIDKEIQRINEQRTADGSSNGNAE